MNDLTPQNDLTPALSLKKARVDNVGARFIAPGGCR